MNNLTLSGRITKAPELRTINDNPNVNFSLAVDREYKSKEGENQADFIDCVAFGPQATYLSNYVKKGDYIELQGRIQTRTYVNKNNQKVKVTEAKVNQLKKISGSKTTESSTTSVQKTTSVTEISDDDLPF